MRATGSLHQASTVAASSAASPAISKASERLNSLSEKQENPKVYVETVLLRWERNQQDLKLNQVLQNALDDVQDEACENDTEQENLEYFKGLLARFQNSLVIQKEFRAAERLAK